MLITLFTPLNQTAYDDLRMRYGKCLRVCDIELVALKFAFSNTVRLRDESRTSPALFTLRD